MALDVADFDHPTWLSAGATFGGYAVLLVAMTALLFGVPYALFLFL